MDLYKGLQNVSNCIDTEFKSVTNLNKLMKRKGCITADGSDSFVRNGVDILGNVFFPMMPGSI
jgi:hypothetical protein